MSDTYVNPLPGLVQWVIKGQARHLLTAAAGALGTADFLPNQAAQNHFVELGMSVVLFVAGSLWSYMDKKTQVAHVADAVISQNLAGQAAVGELPPT